MIRKICRGYTNLRAIGYLSVLKYLTTNQNLILSVTIKNHKIYIRKGTSDLTVAVSCLFKNEFETLKYLYPKSFNGLIVDAGAYIGTFSLAMNDLFPNAEIIAIEPSNDNFDLLNKNTAQNKKIKNINSALVSNNLEEKFLSDPQTGVWGYTTIKDIPDSKVMYKVQTIQLSEIVNSYKRISILKIDIEGGEYEILKNNSEILKQIPVIIIELHERIVKDVEKLFFEFTKDRILIKDSGEKYLSIDKDLLN